MIFRHRTLAAAVVAALALAPAGVPSAHAEAIVVAGCYGELVRTIPLVDRDGVGGMTEIGRLRVDIYFSDAAEGTTCVKTIGGNGTASDPLPMLAMIVTDDGQAVIDQGDYRYYAAVTATGTSGHCLLIHGATQLRSFGAEEASPGDWYFLDSSQRRYCIP